MLINSLVRDIKNPLGNLNETVSLPVAVMAIKESDKWERWLGSGRAYGAAAAAAAAPYPFGTLG